MPGLGRLVSEAALARGWSSLSTQVLRGGDAAGAIGLHDIAGVALRELEEFSPHEVFRLLHQHLYNNDPPAELADSFASLLTSVRAQGT